MSQKPSVQTLSPVTESALEGTPPLSGMALCEECGHAMFSHSTSNQRSYRCSRNLGTTPLHPSGVSVDAGMAEDAVMRTILHTFPLMEKELEAGLENEATARFPSVAPLPQEIKFHTVEEVDYAIARLENERERIQQVEKQERVKLVFAAVRQLLSAPEVEAGSEEWQVRCRQLFILLVERVDMPVDTPLSAVRLDGSAPPQIVQRPTEADQQGQRNRTGDDYTLPNGSPRRACRVTLKHMTACGKVFIAPMYSKNYRAQREVLYVPPVTE